MVRSLHCEQATVITMTYNTLTIILVTVPVPLLVPHEPDYAKPDDNAVPRVSSIVKPMV